ncbi:MAG: gamma-glutamylcyclotransferase [Opitutaceae bacterium]|nr:gamma-glutamylcyclotransferase [Opitutaceae bacterium]
MSLIFVYGTLKRGCSNHHFLAGQTWVGAAATPPGFRLFDLGGFPGMVAQADDHAGVAGEVWSVDATCLAHLDALEGIAEGCYLRASVPLLPPFAGQTVETYFSPCRGRPA